VNSRLSGGSDTGIDTGAIRANNGAVSEQESSTGGWIARVVVGIVLAAIAVAFALVGWGHRETTAGPAGAAAGIAGVGVGLYVVFRRRRLSDDDDNDNDELGFRPALSQRTRRPSSQGSQQQRASSHGARAHGAPGARVLRSPTGEDPWSPVGEPDRWSDPLPARTPSSVPLARRPPHAGQPTDPFFGSLPAPRSAPQDGPFFVSPPGPPPAPPMSFGPSPSFGPPARSAQDALVRAAVFEGARYDAGTPVEGEHGFVAARPFESFVDVVRHLAGSSPQQVLFTVNLFNPNNATARTMFDSYYGYQLVDDAYPWESVDAYLSTLREAARQFERSDSGPR
jgi:hypothetical protein